MKGEEILELLETTIENMDGYEGELKEREDEFKEFRIKKKDGFHPGYVELYIDPDKEYDRIRLRPSCASIFDRNRLSILDEVGEAVFEEIDKATKDRQYLMFKEELGKYPGKVENGKNLGKIENSISNYLFNPIY